MGRWKTCEGKGEREEVDIEEWRREGREKTKEGRKDVRTDKIPSKESNVDQDEDC